MQDVPAFSFDLFAIALRGAWESFQMSDEHAQDKALPQDNSDSEPKPEQKEERAEPAGGAQRHSRDPVKLGPNLEIDHTKPLPELDHGPAKAYQANGTGENQNCFALICDKSLVPRHIASNAYSGIINSTLLSLVKMGTVYWPPAKQQRYVFVYQKNISKRVLEDKAKPAIAWKQDEVMEAVVKPLVSLLQDFRDKDFVHGSIRPSNMFFSSRGGDRKNIILGDCLSLPASYSQPSLYETIQRSMADPVGRGVGTLPDDLYAFGVTLAVFLRQNDPLAGMSDDEIIRHKIEFGSYATITGKDRYKGSILELLRGLLHDDSTQRWTIDEVVSWMDGRRLSPKQVSKPKKAQRPFALNEKKYFYAPLLAMDFDLNVQETARIVEGGDLEQWLTRSLEDDEIFERYEEAVRLSGPEGTGYQDKLAANLSSAMDGKGPIRFKGLRLLGDGVGKALAQVLETGKDFQKFSDIFMQGVAMNWVSMQENPHLDTGSLISRFDSCRAFLRQSKPGYGIERCLYLLCPESHCMSQKLKDYYVRTPEDLLMAFEDMCENGTAPFSFLDRHSIAFLSVKDSKAIDSYLFELGSEENYKRILGTLKCFATIQKRSNLPRFPALATTISDILPEVYKRYHDQNVREKIERNIKRFAADGDLVKMAGLLDNVDLANKDLAGFKMAMKEYAELSREYKKLTKMLDNEASFGKGTGQEVGAVVSSLLSAVIILVVIFMFISGKTIF